MDRRRGVPSDHRPGAEWLAMSARFSASLANPFDRAQGWEIFDLSTGQVVDKARNEARARLLVVRYNREAANDRPSAS